eukprot:14661067-Ditylum_brightwellii.AAC.2
MKEEKADEDTTTSDVKSTEVSKFEEFEENYTDAAEDIKQETLKAVEKKLFSMECAKWAIEGIRIVSIVMQKWLEWCVLVIKINITNADTQGSLPLDNMTYVAKKNETHDEKQVMWKIITTPLTLMSSFGVTTEAMDEPKRSNCLSILDKNIKPKVKSGFKPKVEPENAQKSKMEKPEKLCEKMCKEKNV